MSTLILSLPLPASGTPEYDYVLTSDGQQVLAQGRSPASTLPAQAGRGAEVVAMLPARAARIVNGDYSKPSFEVAMARKDAWLMVEEAKRHGVDLAVMPAVIALFDAAIARGEGALDASAAVRFPLS